ncbi:MAG: dTDP-glucose pyrophosphorylase/predicted transcriptional regulator [Colwellia sp.]|jgi:dTDP-glucose pyrophosphorylase/predicted transcriptional regulator
MSHNWKNILVSPSSNIQHVIKVIDEEALQLALVVDLNNRLLGTITDGDIRRALINGISLSNPISEIMFTTPTVVDCSASKAQLLELMNAKQLNSIPILDNGIVVGLETIHHVTGKAKYDNPVFLMAGGFGTRLRPLTDNCPKPLLKVGDKPILETVLLNFIRAGFYDFYISTHFLPEMIRDYFGDGEKWGVSISYVHENEPLGTGGALGLLPENIPDLPVIVMNGDVLTKIDFEKMLASHNKNAATATMCVREYEYQVPFGVIENNGLKITGMVEKPIQRFHVNAGIYVISSDIVKSVKKNEHIDMPTLLERHITANVMMFPFHEYWLDIGRLDDFKRAQTDIVNLDL